ncbi:hypothetical protein EJ110_NYTH37559 [Nymphaea thermarum]|nr:hypothetical protein EJ110_NYTH37559 [Nymphaea thermarum]
MRPDPLRSATTVANSSLSEGAYFCKDGRKISVGDCALFQAEGSPPSIGIIRWLTTNKEDYPKLGVNWLYRPADVKFKGFLSAPNEVFYSFHRDEISAAFLLHPCKVAFLRKGIELPPGISSFVCRRVYDRANKRLWWLTDKDYINERQEEVNQLLDKTWEEMYAEGRSPKPLNSPVSSQQLKSGSDSVPSSVTSFPSQVKGKKRERSDQGLEPGKRERSSKTDDAESGYSRFDNMMKSEITKITDKEGGLVTLEGVEKLVQLMQPDRNEKKIDLPGRIMLANVISATDKLDCLSRFVQLRGLPVLDDWLQEAHKGKVGDSNSPKEGDKGVEELLLALLRALDKLPVNLLALQSCNIGKSVNHLRNHKNLDIHKKAKSLVDTWKKRVEAEMKSNDAKSGSSQGASWPGKSSFSEVSHGGGKRSGSSDVLKGAVSQPTATKTTSSKFGHGDSVAKSASASPSSGKISLSASTTTGSKDSFSKAPVTSGVSDPPLSTIKEEKSSSSSQSQNNSQSYSSDHAKVAGSAWKEDAKSSTAGSVNAKASGGSSRHRKSSNGFLGSSASQKDSSSTKLGSVNRNQTSDKVSQSGVTSERATDTLLGEHGNSQRLIVRLPNPGRSPAQSLSGGSLEDIGVIGSRASSPVVSEKHDHVERKLKSKGDMSRGSAAPDVNNESWQSNDVKDGLNGSDEGDRSPTAAFDEERVRNCEDNNKTLDISKATCSSGNEKRVQIPETKYVKSYDASFSSINALIESCVKYSEIPAPLSAGDDLGMNLLASVAAGEISKSDTVSPSASPGGDSLLQEDSNNGKESKSRSSHDHVGSHDRGQLDESEDDDSEKQGNDAASSKVEEGSAVTRGRSHIEDDKTGNDRMEKLCASVELHEHEDVCARPEGKCAVGGLPVEPSGTATGKSSPVRATESPVAGEHKQGSDRRKRSTNEEDINGFIEMKKKPKSPLISEKVTLESMHGKILGASMGTQEVGPHTTTCDGSEFANATLNHATENKIIEEPSSSLPVETNAADDKHKNAEDFDGEVSNEEKQPSIAEHGMGYDNGGEDVVLPGSSTTACQDDSDKLKPGDINKLKPGNATDLEDKSAKEPNVGENVEQACNQFDSVGGGTDAKMDESAVANKNDTEEDERSENKATVDQHIDALTCEGKFSSGPVQDTERATTKSVRADVPSVAGSSGLEAVAVDSASKLCFDLNEGFPSDDANQDESISAGTTSVSPAVCQPNSVPIQVSMTSSSISASITVTSAAKGPFILPDNMLRNKGDIRWKGSAATSAFRRAEPQRVPEALASISELPCSETPAGKFGRPLLDIDLNEPDERGLEDVPAQPAVALESGSVRSMKTMESKLPASSACGSGRLDLDLNRAEEGPENGQMAGISNRRSEVPVSSARPSSSSGGLSNGDHAPRNFDLNDGPSFDEGGADPGPHYSHPKNNASYLPPVVNLRMNELGNLSSWFPPGGSYPQVSIPPFVSERVEPPYSIVATAAGVQRILGPTSGGPAAFGADIYRAPVLSSSPAMGFTAASAFPYGGFPFGGGFPLASTSFTTSSTFIESSSGGGPCFPPIPSQLVGPGATVSATYGRPYLISHPDGPGGESSRKWPRQGLDLNAGPGSIDTDARDERFISARQLPVANSQALAEEQARLYQAAGGTALKRKEPEGGWDAERFGYKQPAWQ